MKEKRPEDRELGYKLFMPVFNKFFKFYFNPKTIGKENIPSDGAIVIAGNHKHFDASCHHIPNCVENMLPYFISCFITVWEVCRIGIIYKIFQ